MSSTVSFGVWLIQQMNEREMNLVQMERHLGSLGVQVSYASLVLYRSQQSCPPFEKMKAICIALDPSIPPETVEHIYSETRKQVQEGKVAEKTYSRNIRIRTEALHAEDVMEVKEMINEQIRYHYGKGDIDMLDFNRYVEYLINKDLFSPAKDEER